MKAFAFAMGKKKENSLRIPSIVICKIYGQGAWLLGPPRVHRMQ